MRTIDPRLVSAFISVVQHGGFRGAAKALGVSKSAVSARVAELESHLGARLLARTTRSVRLTDIGRSYHQLVGKAMRSLDEAESLVRQMSAQPRGRLRLSAPNELGQALFGEALATYGQMYPEVTLDVELTDRRVDLIDEGFDLVLRIGPLPDSGLVTRKLGRELHMGVYASPSYLELHGTPEDPRDLVRHRCMAMSGSSSPVNWTFLRRGKREQVQVAPAVSINSFQVLSSLAAAGMGIARLPRIHAQRFLTEARLTEVLQSFAPPPTVPLAVYPRGRLTPAVRAMIDLWIDLFKRPMLQQGI